MKYDIPKGTKEYYFTQAQLKNLIIRKIEQIYQRWGYQPLYTPSLQMMNVLNAKSGQEIQGQIFGIKDSDYGLRFDLTVGTARFVATKKIPMPYKRYQIGQVWRREEPQHSRLREFTQADIDIFGLDEPQTDAEVIAVAANVLDELNFDEYYILLNNREILEAIIKKYQEEKNENKILRILDKIDKIGKDKVYNELIDLKINKNLIDQIFEIDLQKANEICPQGTERLKKIRDILINEFKIKNVEIDFSLARGLAYYSSSVFEIKTKKESTSIAGGGRYDNLTEIYGQKISAVGISFGIERLLNLIEENKNNIKIVQPVYILTTENKYLKNAIDLLKKLHEKDIDAFCDYTQRNISKKLEYANLLNIEYVVIIGKNEVENNSFTLKNMYTKNQQDNLSLDELIKTIKQNR